MSIKKLFVWVGITLPEKQYTIIILNLSGLFPGNYLQLLKKYSVAGSANVGFQLKKLEHY